MEKRKEEKLGFQISYDFGNINYDSLYYLPIIFNVIQYFPCTFLYCNNYVYKGRKSNVIHIKYIQYEPIYKQTTFMAAFEKHLKEYIIKCRN